jgi:hypothetical protein
MKYLLLIYGEEARWSKVSDRERETLVQEYMQFTRDIAQSGHYLGGNQLQPTVKATSVRLRDGKRLVTDGPFAETKEALGGYYLVEAKDLDEAVALAERIPSVRWGTIEVRAIIPHDMP